MALFQKRETVPKNVRPQVARPQVAFLLFVSYFYETLCNKKTKPLARLCRQSEAYLSEWANMLFCFLIYIQQPQNVNF